MASIESIGLALGGGKERYAQLQQRAFGPRRIQAQAPSPTQLASMGIGFQKVNRG